MSRNPYKGKLQYVDVVIVEGSDSDDPVILDSALQKIFDKCGISSRVTVASAHRHAKQDKLPAYLEACADTGTRTFVGIAGMAAVLPGIIAANLEEAIVYGVPVTNDQDLVRDLAALLAMIENPPGTVVRVCGRGSIGLTNTALAIAQDFSTARSNPEVYGGLLQEYRAEAAAKKLLEVDHTPKRKEKAA